MDTRIIKDIVNIENALKIRRGGDGRDLSHAGTFLNF